MDSMGATPMTDMSLFYESDVTVPSVYGAPVTPKTMTVDACGQKEVDRRRAAWMVAAQAGDRAAYETLLRDCIPFIKQVARGQGIRPDLIDDVVQETLLTVHRARQTYDPNRSFTAWLRTIAQRRAIDVLRRVGRTRTREVYAPLAYENHSDPSGATEETAFHIDQTQVPVRPSANFQPGSARRWSISHSSPNRLRRPRRLPDGRLDRFG